MQYYVVDIDSGVLLMAARYELTYIPVTVMAKADDIPIPESKNCLIFFCVWFYIDAHTLLLNIDAHTLLLTYA